MKTGVTISIIVFTIAAIVGGVVIYQERQDTRRERQAQRAEQLRQCQAPYHVEAERAQIVLSSPLYLQEGSAALAHANDGLAACVREFGRTE